MVLAQRPSQPTPHWPNKVGSGSVKPTQPTLHTRPLSDPSLSPELSGDTKSPPPPGLSGQLRRATPSPPWVKHSPLHPLSPPPSRFISRSRSEEICDEIPLGKMALCRLCAWFLTGLLLLPAASLCGGHGVAKIRLVAKQARVEAAQVGLLLVLSLPLRWSLPQAALGWPREPCLAMLTRSAPGRLVSLTPPPPALFVSGLCTWPSWPSAKLSVLML
jgi:hypothetical protein